VKANFTDVRISAMEDFIGRGDRRLGAVVRRAWELGAGMDSWFESVEKAFAAWEEAISSAGLTWKYRQVESGEWNVMEAAAEDILDRPLPWDHINTGIEKEWLKADLAKALEAATVPDCSFDGCSHCGVCTPDFGHNTVISPPPIPEFAGHFKPNHNRAVRMRVKFGKLDNMALIGHLDLARLFDRAVRRASLPVAFTGGFHASPRISIASALSLGATSSGEIADFELTQPMDAETFREKLAGVLPAEIPLYSVEEVDLKARSASQLLERAEYYITVAAAGAGEASWEDWVRAITGSEAIVSELTAQSGQTKLVNLRERLFELEVVECREDKSSQPELPLPSSVLCYRSHCALPHAVLRYTGSCRNDGNLLRPEHLVCMLEQVTGHEFQLLHAHRNQLFLSGESANSSL
jgi:radical SAM-linked protein